MNEQINKKKIYKLIKNIEPKKKNVNLSQYFCFSLILGYRLLNFLKSAPKQVVHFFG